jgi:hypothetical protein
MASPGSNGKVVRSGPHVDCRCRDHFDSPSRDPAHPVCGVHAHVALAKTPLRLERLYIEGDRDSLCGMPSEISQIQCGDLLCLKKLEVNSCPRQSSVHLPDLPSILRQRPAVLLNQASRRAENGSPGRYVRARGLAGAGWLGDLKLLAQKWAGKRILGRLAATRCSRPERPVSGVQCKG